MIYIWINKFWTWTYTIHLPWLTLFISFGASLQILHESLGNLVRCTLRFAPRTPWVCQLVYPHRAVTITRVKHLNPLLLLLRKIVVSAGCIHPARNKGSTHIAGEKCRMMTLLLMFCPLCWRPQWNPSSGLVRGDALKWRRHTWHTSWIILKETGKIQRTHRVLDILIIDTNCLRKRVISVCSLKLTLACNMKGDGLPTPAGGSRTLQRWLVVLNVG